MKKVIVIQTHFGKGFMTRESSDTKTSIFTKQILKKCQKSVREWCKEQQYEYRLVTEKPDISIDLSYPLADQFQYSYYQYQCFPKEGYDNIIFLDNDIWIIDPKSTIPLVDWACSTTHDAERNAFLQFRIDPLAKFWNGSILVMNQDRANHLGAWMVSGLEDKIEVPTWDKELRKERAPYNSHEMLLSWYCWHEAVPQHLPAEWHCRPKRFVEWERAKMLHFDGSNKPKQLLRLPIFLKEQFENII
jgi:hypothetical protein